MLSRIAVALRRAPRQDTANDRASEPGAAPPRGAGGRWWKSRRVVVVALVLGLAVAMLAIGLVDGGVPVDAGRVHRGSLRVTVTGTGKARVRQRHVISAHVAGRLQRISLLPGDAVQGGQVLAVIDPSTPTLLDARSRAAQEARLKAAVAAEAGARAALQRARAAERAATSDWERAEHLATAGAVSAQDLEAAELKRRSRVSEREMAEASAQQARQEAEEARAVLAGAAGARAAGSDVKAPAGGYVLRVLRESEGSVEAGAPLLEVGDLADLEVAVDLLTTDAVRVRVGAPVSMRHWGGDRTLDGRVQRVDPSGFTKVSALGVEEQRVHAVVGPVTPGGWANLADNYKVEAEILVAERHEVLLAPVASLIRGREGWSVFTVEGGKGRLRAVQIGAMGTDEAEITAGLSGGEMVVLYPGDQVRDGARLAVN